MRLIFLPSREIAYATENHHHRPGKGKDTHNSHLDRVATRGRASRDLADRQQTNTRAIPSKLITRGALATSPSLMARAFRLSSCRPRVSTASVLTSIKTGRGRAFRRRVARALDPLARQRAV